MSVDSRKSREKPFTPKPPNTPRNPIHFDTKKFFEKNTDNFEQILNSGN